MNTRKNAHKGGHSVGLLIAGTAVATSAATYYLYGPKGAQHRKAVKGWALKASGELLEQIERVKKVSKPKYERLVAKVSNKYKKLQHINAKDVEKFKRDLISQWKHIEKAAQKGVSQGRRELARMAKKTRRS